MSRSISRTSAGKATEEIKVRVSEDVKSELAALAAVHGYSLSEYCRVALTTHTRGHFHVLQLAVGARDSEGRE
ncbi:hypothetical protein [Thioalkalivibrio sp. ARh3]|uniref:hypothetical protein n=1 Tax=Thioalkalivibrio sp. ARh3 TaxID=1158148 RepID=UPI001E48EC0F|nr:hypothetical protein [Thioalkalivibrio sp. ARh3]